MEGAEGCEVSNAFAVTTCAVLRKQRRKQPSADGLREVGGGNGGGRSDHEPGVGG